MKTHPAFGHLMRGQRINCVNTSGYHHLMAMSMGHALHSAPWTVIPGEIRCALSDEFYDDASRTWPWLPSQ